MDDTNRGTGRTTRMLRSALVEALHGTTVIVIGWREPDLDHMFQMFLRLPGVLGLKPMVFHTRKEIDFGKGRMIFRAASHGDFDWRARRVPGYDPRTPVYIDHYAQEQYTEQERNRAINAKRDAKLAAMREGLAARRGRKEDPPAT